MKNRIKLFTHTDLDGIGCSLLFLKNNKISKEDIEYLDYTNINETITEFIYSCEYKNYDKMTLTNEQIKKFEEDVRNGKNIDIEEYLVKEQTIKNNKLASFGKKTSITISSTLSKVISKSFAYLGKFVKE